MDESENAHKQRQTAVYDRTIAFLRTTSPDMPDDEMDRLALIKVNEGVYGIGAKQNRDGSFQEMGIGSESNPSVNDLAAVKKYEGEEAWRRKCALLWKRNPQWAAANNLPKPLTT